MTSLGDGGATFCDGAYGTGMTAVGELVGALKRLGLHLLFVLQCTRPCCQPLAPCWLGETVATSALLLLLPLLLLLT